MTIEELARLTQEEFISTHKEIGDLKTEIREGFVGMENKFDSLTTIIMAVRDDLKEIRRNTAETQVELIDIRRRVARLEEKAGIKD